VRDTGALEQATAAGLDPVASEAVIDAVDRDVELEREAALEVPHLNSIMNAPLPFGTSSRSRASKSGRSRILLRERPRRVVHPAEQVNASAGGLSLGDQSKVVLDDLFSRRKAADDHEPDARAAERKGETQAPLP
jgi:hypothetical protein